MMDDNRAVPREVHVQLEAIGPKRQTVVERLECILRRQRRAAAMGKDQRTG